MLAEKWRQSGRLVFTAVFLSGFCAGIALADDTDITMYKDPNCGCCGKWAEHMRRNGFTVKEVATSGMAGIKQESGVPPELSSCHTATVGGYIVEGHVPAEDVKQLLEKRPALAGIAAPGMPPVHLAWKVRMKQSGTMSSALPAMAQPMYFRNTE